jgi:hypothetical protein
MWEGSHVTALDLSEFNLTGALSLDLSHLRFLTNLSVAANQFSGPIPGELSSLSALRFLNLSNNIFNSTFPSTLARLKNLQALDLYNNNMSGELPLTVTKMPNLRHLHLGGNFLLWEIIFCGVGTQPGIDAVRVENVVALGDQTQLFQRLIMSLKAKFLIEIRNPGKVRERERERERSIWLWERGSRRSWEAILRKHSTFLSPTLLRKGNLSRFLFYKRIPPPTLNPTI